MRRMLVEYVQSAYRGITVLEAADGARALESCRSGRPRLVLMDVALPDANGIELTVQIREMLPETEVVVVSQHAVEAYVDRARAAGAFAYITKDKVYRELLPTIERALGRAPLTVDMGMHNE
jgi:DNA-binding NarL/FixJ family response regulator